MITIYHNPRCGKSRECEILLRTSGENIKVINYIKTPFTVEKLSELLEILGIKPIELIRTNEAIWKDQYKERNMRNATIIQAMVQHPNLIQRPIVVKNKKAIVAGPLEKLDSFL